MLLRLSGRVRLVFVDVAAAAGKSMILRSVYTLSSCVRASKYAFAWQVSEN